MMKKEQIEKVSQIVKNKALEAYDKNLLTSRTPQDREDYIYLTGFLAALKYVSNSDEPNYNTTFEKYLKHQI